MTDDSIIDDIIKREGGYTDHPDDKGGPTKYGITLNTLKEYKGTSITKDDVILLSREEAKEIYKALYIIKPHFDKIPDPRVRAIVIDAGVNHGIGKATRLLQRALAVTDDGVLGSETEEQLAKMDSTNLFRRFFVERLLLYHNIVIINPSQNTFLRGWFNRMSTFIELI